MQKSYEITITTQVTMMSDDRLDLADLMQCKEEQERSSEQAMAELAQQAQNLGMGYE
ncbi:hypothetical protein [Stenotrophomonas sp. PS02289]|uniref:hypothetical protein n=1 Tax=Stenotrophomonas sp. PS02289 TaxID=2991422 RepID=UPI00249B4A04|nr:hypothetical protein [Stenotrophomonas sp. PS02289]